MTESEKKNIKKVHVHTVSQIDIDNMRAKLKE